LKVISASCWFLLYGYITILHGYITILHGYITILHGYITMLHGYITMHGQQNIKYYKDLKDMKFRSDVIDINFNAI